MKKDKRAAPGGQAVLLSPDRDQAVDRLLQQLAAEPIVLEDFIVWVVEDMTPKPVAMELRSLRRAIDAKTLDEDAMPARLEQLTGAAIAATTIGLGRARDPGAATMLAAMQLGRRGDEALVGALQCSQLHAAHDEVAAERDGLPSEEVARAVSGAYERQLSWLNATVRGGTVPAPRFGERYLFGDAPFNAAEVVEAVAGPRLAGPPEAEPRAVIVMGGPGAGKTTYRLQMHPELVAIDASDVYLRLCSDKSAPFPGSALRRMTEVGHLLLRRALEARKSIVIEVVGAEEESMGRLIDSLKRLGYSVELELIHCTVEEAMRRYEVMTEDRISSAYTEAHHLAWVEAAAAELPGASAAGCK